MLVKLIIFFVDLMFASAIIGILYAVYLIVATGIFIIAIFYIFNGDMGKNYNFNGDRSCVLESRNATGKPLADNTESVPRCLLDTSLPSDPQRSLLSKDSSAVEEPCGRIS